MRRLLLLIAALALLAPATALAGGWATAGLSSTPEGLGPNEPWKTQITLMQHGRTPLEGVEPAIVIENTKTHVEQRFAAKPTKEPGVYDVTVTFPAKGDYTYTVDDGFGNGMPHEFPAVTIGAPAAAPASAPAAPAADDGGPPVLPLVLGGVALLLAAGGVYTVRRRRSGSAVPA